LVAKLDAHQRIVNALHWDDRAQGYLATWGIKQSDAESIILHDRKPVLDPHSTEAGHPIIRFKRGDVTVVVGFRDPKNPKVLSVFVTKPKEPQFKQRTATSSGQGSSLPTSVRELKIRMINFGYRLKMGHGGHLSVIHKESGLRICQISSTPSDKRTIANEWRRFLKEHALHEARRKAEEDRLLQY